MVIDNTSQFRMDHDVPLVVPEVNPHALAKFARRNIIANPNCSTIQMVVALKPLHDGSRSSASSLPTYQSVSGAGKEGMDELFTHTKSVVRARAGSAAAIHQGDRLQLHPPHRQVHGRRVDQGRVEDGGRDRKILDPDILVHATCVRVPVFIGHGEAVNVEFELPVTANEARAALREARACRWSIIGKTAATSPHWNVLAKTRCSVSRIRKDPTVAHGCRSGAYPTILRKGAALNAVQIAETMIAMSLLTKRAA